MNNSRKILLDKYHTQKSAIKKRLHDFARVGRRSDPEIFEELCFCLFTPQTKAVNCDLAIRTLKGRGLIAEGSPEDIARVLHRVVRFHNNKARYLVGARGAVTDGARAFRIKKEVRELLRQGMNRELREWLVQNVKGLGYKEASHFLRNIGHGKGLAILDVHILKNLKALGVISAIPSSITRKRYFEIEEKMASFSRDIGIPLEEMDLLFWSNETGFVFK